jgi:broad specificity phosphatase PhoE
MACACPANPEEIKNHPDVHLRTLRRDKCCFNAEYYVLDQAFAIVRHGDRMDHFEEEWEKYPERYRYPNDAPLTENGRVHAYGTGDVLSAHVAKVGPPFAFIVSSPYLRCAQTACCIAEKLSLPVQFDLDLGEVFDQNSMRGDVSHKRQHRPPAELERLLRNDFPTVQINRDHKSQKLSIRGHLQKFPEPLERAKMRFRHKVDMLVQQAATELVSIIIVTHGDALPAVLEMLLEDTEVESVPYCSCAIGTRQVQLMKKDTDKVLRPADVFMEAHQWNFVTLDKIVCTKVGDWQKWYEQRDTLRLLNNFSLKPSQRYTLRGARGQSCTAENPKDALRIRSNSEQSEVLVRDRSHCLCDGHAKDWLDDAAHDVVPAGCTTPRATVLGNDLSTTSECMSPDCGSTTFLRSTTPDSKCSSTATPYLHDDVSPLVKQPKHVSCATALCRLFNVI